MNNKRLLFLAATLALGGCAEQGSPVGSESGQGDAAGGNALRAYLDAKFDVPVMLTQLAVRNWAGVGDDVTHNYFPYRRPGDGRWVYWPQALDQDFGAGLKDSEGGPVGVDKVLVTTSFYEGEEGDIPSRDASPAGKICDVRARITQIRQWATGRHAVLVQRLE